MLETRKSIAPALAYCSRTVSPVLHDKAPVDAHARDACLHASCWAPACRISFQMCLMAHTFSAVLVIAPGVSSHRKLAEDNSHCFLLSRHACEIKPHGVGSCSRGKSHSCFSWPKRWKSALNCSLRARPIHTWHARELLDHGRYGLARMQLGSRMISMQQNGARRLMSQNGHLGRYANRDPSGLTLLVARVHLF